MTPRAFLGVEPKVTAASLAQRDPVVLAMVAAHLNREPTWCDKFQRTGLILSAWKPRSSAALLGLQQFLEFLPQITQGRESCCAVLPLRSQLILNEGFALSDQLKTLLMMLKPLLKNGARSPQFFGTAVQRLGLIHLISAGIAKAEKSIRLALKRTMSFGGLKAMALVIVGGLFFAPPSLQALTQLMADPCQGPLFQALLVKGTQLESE